MSRYMAFVDGENLTNRFEAMIKDGRQPRTPSDKYDPRAVIHLLGRMAWSPATFLRVSNEAKLLRVHYYTTFSGASDEFEVFRQQVAGLRSVEFAGGMVDRPMRDMPVLGRVFQKSSRRTKTKSVDINLCVDVLEYTHQNALDGIVLVSGDVDYLPLINAVMRSGRLAVVAALSSGLSSELRLSADTFLLLDDVYFAS
jgi:uncharacterized LabA/DUF88 family protein